MSDLVATWGLKEGSGQSAVSQQEPHSPQEGPIGGSFLFCYLFKYERTPGIFPVHFKGAPLGDGRVESWGPPGPGRALGDLGWLQDRRVSLVHLAVWRPRNRAGSQLTSTVGSSFSARSRQLNRAPGAGGHQGSLRDQPPVSVPGAATGHSSLRAALATITSLDSSALKAPGLWATAALVTSNSSFFRGTSLSLSNAAFE